MTSLNTSGSNLESSSSSLNASTAIKTTSPENDNNNNSNSNIDNSRAAKIKKLKAKLINEEHRLVLMKKIRQSQTRPVNQQQQLQQQQQQQPQQAAHQQANSNPTNQLPNNANANNNIQIINNNCQTANPAKKLRPSQSLNNSNNNNNNNNNNLLNASGNLLLQKNLLNNNINNIANLPPGTSSMNQTPAHAHQRTKSNTLWNQPLQIRQPTPAGLAPPHVGNLSRNPITTPPNVVQAMMGSLNANQQSLLMNQINALTAAAVSGGASGLLGTPGGSANRRSGASNLLRQPITTPPNVIQDVRGGATLTPSTVASGSQHVSNRRAHSGNLTSTRQQQHHHQQQPLVTAPNVLQDIRGALSGQQQSLLMNANNMLTPSSRSSGASASVGAMGRSQQSSLSMTPQHQQQQSPFNKAQAAQILLQRRTAAKQAVQKQLEQTLMQLPQKHIQLGIDFVPNANNIEFVCYIGLEACVDYLTQTKNPLDTQPLEKPFECSTCGTDFTPSWSWKRSNPVCENCVSNHVKKSIKNSQANRIKSVLAKAVKQEQEIDQKIMSEAANVVTSPSTPTTSSGQASSNNQRHSSLLQPASHSSTPRSSSSSQQQQHRQQQHQQQQQQSTPNWPRLSQSPSTLANRSTASMSSSTNTTPTTNVLPNINLNNPLAALSSLQPAALASLLEMSPQFSTLASLMAGNAAAAPPPPPPPPPAPVNTAANSNQIAQVAALLMNQLTANLWNKR